MIRQPVTSSAIKSLGHEQDVLEVEMASGQVYRYTNVPRELFEKLLNAESIGSAFHHQVKKAGFAFEKVEPDGNEEGPAPER